MAAGPGNWTLGNYRRFHGRLPRSGPDAGSRVACLPVTSQEQVTRVTEPFLPCEYTLFRR